MTEHGQSRLGASSSQPANEVIHDTYPSAMSLPANLSRPPSLIHHLSPYASIPLPPVTSIPVTLNPMLRYWPRSNIRYLLVSSPLSATLNRLQPAHLQWLKEPATFPTSPYLTIRATWQERAIVVLPGDTGTVTIWDVLVAVHSALHAKATYIYSNTHYGMESALFQVPGQRDNNQWNEGAIGASMMMLLQGRAVWQGLSSSTVEADVWLLHVG